MMKNRWQKKGNYAILLCMLTSRFMLLFGLHLFLFCTNAIAQEGFKFKDNDAGDPYIIETDGSVVTDNYLKINIKIKEPDQEDYELVSAEFIEVKTEMYSSMKFVGDTDKQRPLVTHIVHEQFLLDGERAELGGKKHELKIELPSPQQPFLQITIAVTRFSASGEQIQMHPTIYLLKDTDLKIYRIVSEEEYAIARNSHYPPAIRDLCKDLSPVTCGIALDESDISVVDFK